MDNDRYIIHKVHKTYTYCCSFNYLYKIIIRQSFNLFLSGRCKIALVQKWAILPWMGPNHSNVSPEKGGVFVLSQMCPKLPQQCLTQS